MLVAPREKRNCQLPTANGAQLGFSCAQLLLSFFADWGEESQLSAVGDPKLDFPGGGEGREKVFGVGTSNPAHCHGVVPLSTPYPGRTFFLRPLVTITEATPLPRGQAGSSLHPLTPSRHCLHPVPRVPTRLHQSKCPLALPQDEPGTQPPQVPGVGWLSLAG